MLGWTFILVQTLPTLFELCAITSTVSCLNYKNSKQNCYNIFLN